MAECTPLRARSFSRSHGPASSVSTAPASSQPGRPPGKSSSITHCAYGSAATAARSVTPSARRAASIVSGGAGRHDPVHHGARAGDVAGHPLDQPGGHPPARPTAWSSMPRSRRPLAGRLSQLTRAIGPASAAARASQPAQQQPRHRASAVGRRPGPRRAPSPADSRPVTGSSWYAFSVTVRVTTRIAGSASSATTASGSLGRVPDPAERADHPGGAAGGGEGG